uniref:Uncharacterized protein n=1 Tax=Podoviridae sp. cthau23 TaxID=2825268 RepID=A0A8S5U741_9CAUD|nr:MAG TPA: hypothetical protein [Podoviridae sp. cthau23]
MVRVRSPLVSAVRDGYWVKERGEVTHLSLVLFYCF